MVSSKIVQFISLSLMWVAIILANYNDIDDLPKTVYHDEGDINIGAVFPLHQAGVDGKFCGPIRELGVLQRAEAMAFYLRQINDNSKYLPNIKLGFTILDDCYKETTALAQGLQFIHADTALLTGTNLTSDLHKAKPDYVAVIGAESSTNSKQLAELLGLFKIPQISYLSTSPSLGNNVTYPYFTRIVPSDKFQVAAIMDLLDHFDWSYVSFIFSYSFYGLEAYFLLLTKMRESIGRNMCLAVEHGLPENPTDVDYIDAVKRLTLVTNKVSSHVVVLFLSQTAAMGILEIAQREGHTGKFTFIASDAWGRNDHDFKGVERVAAGALTIKISSSNDPVFDEHFSKLNFVRSDNPFLKEYWDAACEKSQVTCQRGTNFGSLHDVYKPESTVSLVKMSVYLLANALQELFGRCRHVKKNHEQCNGKEFREYITSDDLQQLLWNLQGCIDGNCVDIDMYGEGQSSYSIMNLQRINGNYTLRKVGVYNTKENKLDMKLSNDPKIFWNPYGKSKGGKDVPMSICSETCQMGQKQKQMGFENSRCCWVCEDCATNEYTNVTIVDGLSNYQCEPCRICKTSKLHIFTSPVESGDGCRKIVPMSMDTTYAFAIVIIALDIICLIATCILLVIYVRNKTHRLIKATSLELSYIIWSGVIFSYVSLFCYFVPLQQGCVSADDCDNPSPNTHWCYIQFITFSLAFTVINAPMLTRVNRIYRIFKKGKKSAMKPRFIENRYQLIIVGILILVQIIIIMVCCVVSHFLDNETSIKITNYQEDKSPTESYIACEIPYPILLPPIAYNLLLGIACAYHAFTTRKLPDNFNESRFIGMTVYTTVIMWIAFIPAYITINSKHYKGVPLSVSLLINAVITTGCLFVPRLYALRWVEGGRMNLRTLSISLHSMSEKSRHSSTLESKSDRKRSDSNDSVNPVNLSETPPKYYDNGREGSSFESATSTTAYLSNNSVQFSEDNSHSSSSPEHEYDVIQ